MSFYRAIRCPYLYNSFSYAVNLHKRSKVVNKGGQGWFLFPPQFLWFAKVIEGTHPSQRIRDEEKLGVEDGRFTKNLR